MYEDGSISVRELAQQVGLSSPSIAERILKLKDAGAIQGYTVIVDPSAFGLEVSAFLQLRAMPGQTGNVAQMLCDIPQVVEAYRVTGADCFVARIVVCDVQQLETVVVRFIQFASTHTVIIQSSTVARRLPKL